MTAMVLLINLQILIVELLVLPLCAPTKVLPRGRYGEVLSPAALELRGIMEPQSSTFKGELPPRQFVSVTPRTARSDSAAAAVKRTLLGPRQSCNVGYGYCYNSGRCCPDTYDGCCDDGTCVSADETCCISGGFCKPGKECCHDYCIDEDEECCTEGFCPRGKECVLFDGKHTCCNDLSCSEYDTTDTYTTYEYTSYYYSDYTETYTTTYPAVYQTYYTTFYWYYYTIFLTTTFIFRTTIFVTSTYVTETTTLTATATDSVEADITFLSLSHDIDFATQARTAPAAKTFLATATAAGNSDTSFPTSPSSTTENPGPTRPRTFVNDNPTAESGDDSDNSFPTFTLSNAGVSGPTGFPTFLNDNLTGGTLEGDAAKTLGSNWAMWFWAAATGVTGLFMIYL